MRRLQSHASPAVFGSVFLRLSTTVFLGVVVALLVPEVGVATSLAAKHGSALGAERLMARAAERDTARGAVRLMAQAPERETAKGRDRKKAKGKGRKAAAPVENRGIDTSSVWRAETEVFSAEQLAKLEPILNASTCRNEKVGCPYQDNGKPGSEDSFAFRLIPWKVSKHRSYLVRNDRCGAGGCDQGLFVLIDGRWRLVAETFGILERASSSTLGFNDLRFLPRGQAPMRLVWDGRAYREAPIN